MRHAADIASGDYFRCGAFYRQHLALAQLRGDVRLQYIIGAGRAAAEMTLRDFHHLETGFRQKLFRFLPDLLTMLQLAGAVIGDTLAGFYHRRL